MRRGALRPLVAILLGALLALLLAACASPPARQLADGAQRWSGRLGLQVESEPPQNYQAAFELQGNPDAGELTLFSPLGGVWAQLQWNAQQATLVRGEQRWQHRSVDSLMQQLVPGAVPLASLFDWLQGRQAADPSWQVDLSAQPQGRVLAQRQHPLPRAQLRVVFER